MKDSDTLQRFIFEHASIRGEIAHLDETYRTVMEQHPYPEEVRTLLGEALISCVLLAGSIKFEGEISLQFHGDHRLPLLLIQCDHQLNVRGFAKYQEPEDKNTVDYYDSFLAGKMILTINQYNKTQAYQSVVPIDSTSMSENIMHYFAQSEQVSTRVWLAVTGNKAAGMLLQLMPGQDTQQREQFWEYAVHLGETITDEELISLDNPTILHRLYHETELRLYHARAVKFQCRCTQEKMKDVLTILGEEDLNKLLEEQSHVTISCDFCNKKYEFDAIDVAMLFRR
ncbi:Hsp33 family molecular chaperone HslO [Legionella yabuuchiae]|uniref:Hsp33 family molecular chaperone HslO n=1 Tax=Legionella yabuuchiae TaxID=376727 RepID=UPI0010549379|nr:Hsp33 family molecular chaperone HslO [Legionella yabuuchiae]